MNRVVSYGYDENVNPNYGIFKKTVAHEFGHLAFNIRDNIRDSAHTTVPVSKSIYANSIMTKISHVDGNYSELDLACMIRNYEISGFKKGLYYADHVDLLNKYSPTWHYKVYQ